MRANLVTTDESKAVAVHFEHCVDRGVGYGQLWIDGRFHIEFTKAGLEQLAADAVQLAAAL